MNNNASVSFRVPDFVGPDGTEYTDIEVIVEMAFTMPSRLSKRCNVRSRTEASMTEKNSVHLISPPRSSG